MRLSVAPLRWGAGVKGKVNSAMAFGVPAVATTVAVEAMFPRNGSNILVVSRVHTFKYIQIRSS